MKKHLRYDLKTVMPKNVLKETINRLLSEAEGDEEGAESPEAAAETMQTPPADPEREVEKAQASIDKQVKKFFRDALEEAGNSKTEGVDFRRLSRRLYEADDEPLIDPEGGDEAAAPAAPSKKTLESIDIGSYTESIVRVIDNFNNLINIKDTLVEMAKVNLQETYDDSTVKAFTDLLSEEYDIEIGASEWDKEIENQPPPARGAGTSG